MKKRILLFGLMLCFLSGCSNKDSEEVKTQNGTIKETESISITEKQETDTNPEEGNDKEVVVWGIEMVSPSTAKCEKAINELLEKEGKTYGVHFEPISVGFDGNYDHYADQYLENAKSGHYDIITIPRYAACYDVYHRFIDEGAVVSLGGKNDERCALNDVYPDMILDAMTYRNGLYGVLSPMLNSFGYAVFNKQYLPDGYADKQSITLKEIDEIFKTVSQTIEETDFVYSPMADEYVSDRYEFTPFSFAVLDRTDRTVKSFIETEVFSERYDLFSEWNQSGFLSSQDVNVIKKVQKGDFLMLSDRTYSRETAVSNARFKYEIPEEIELIAIEIIDYRTCFRGTGFFSSVCTAGKNSNAAKDLLKSIYSDASLMNALLYGKEGEDYSVQDGRCIPTDPEFGQYINLLMFDNPFLSKPGKDEPVNKQELIAEAVAEMETSLVPDQDYRIGELINFAEEIDFVLQGEDFKLLKGKEDPEKSLEELRKFLAEHKADEILEQMNMELRWGGES